MRQILLKRLSFFVFFIFLLNTAASFFSWYTLLPWYDNMMHFLGGAWLALVFCFLFISKIEQKKATLISLLLFVFIGALLWEFLEYGIEHIADVKGLLANPKDSVSDVIFGILGGFLLGYKTIRSITKQ